jgi:hypothetical protein
MPRQNVPLLAFNRGIISPKGLARVDLDRMPFSADIQRNWIPRTLGSMTLRPGWQFIHSTASDNAAYHLPFVFATDDTALIEFTDNLLRVIVNDVLVTRPSVTAAVANGGFDTDLTSWTDADETTAASTWKTGGYLSLVGTGTDYAIRRQEVTVTETGTQHALNFEIERGPVDVRVGSASGLSDYIDAALLTGTHSIAFTPTGNFFIEFRSNLLREVLVNSVAVDAAGVMTLVSPYAAADLEFIRYSQSADVIFLAAKGHKQKRLERRGVSSWSLVDYDSNDGPFNSINSTVTTITPSALAGNITLTASDDLFSVDQVGGLFRLESSGQTVEAAITAEATFTDPVRITGVGSSRGFAVTVSNTFVATVTLQRSIAAPGDWQDVESYTVPTSKTFNDELDNQIIFYRIGVKSGDFTSGTVDVNLSFTGGTAVGVARITGFTSSLVVDAEVLDAMGSTDATAIWYEGIWSTKNGFPSSVALFEGRLWWAGKNFWFGSVSDAFSSFDLDVEGDSGPIIRVIGSGPVDTISWLLPLNRLLAGTAGSVITAKSSSFDEPLTPTNFNLKSPDTQGADNIDALQVDDRGVYVNRSQTRVMELQYDGSKFTYASVDLMILVPDLARIGIKRIGVQRKPDTRVHVILNDGTVIMLITDPAEEVKAWITIDTDGLIEDVVVLPGIEEDQVYYVVNRTGGRYLEKWALESECEGAATNKQGDSFIISTGQVITGLDHVEGETVVVWADSKDRGTFVVASGQIDLGTSFTSVMVGLSYDALFKSSKLAYAAGMGTALTQRKKVSQLAMILHNTHAQGVKYGTELPLDDMPQYEFGAQVDQDSIWEHYDAPAIEVNGEWGSDERLFITAAAPRPATVLCVVPTLVTHDKS